MFTRQLRNWLRGGLGDGNSFGITCMAEFTEFDVTHERSYIKKKRERLKMDPEDNPHFKGRRKERILRNL